MDLHQMECVLAVSERGSFTKAAESLYVTQSALSYAIGRLERELGVQLFARLGRRVVLTPAGEAFLPRARQSVEAARDAREAACAVGGVLTGQLRLVVTPTLTRFAAEGLAGFHRLHPEVRISLTVRHPNDALDLVRSSALPMAIMGLYTLPDQLKGVELFREETVVVLPPGTEHDGTVRRDELDRIPLVVSQQAQAPQLRAQQEWLSSQRTRIVAETDNTDATIELVLAGIGAAVLSREGTGAAAERGAVIASIDPPSHYEVGLVYRPGRLTPVEREFRDHLVTHAKLVGGRDPTVDRAEPPSDRE